MRLIAWIALVLVLARPLSAADDAAREYSVVMHDRWGFGLELTPEKQGLTGVARRDALRERRGQLMREAAEALAREYGCAVRALAYGGEPRFSCAMVEASARRMADDPRVWRVIEEARVVSDDPLVEPPPARDPFPPPGPWRPANDAPSPSKLRRVPKGQSVPGSYLVLVTEAVAGPRPGRDPDRAAERKARLESVAADLTREYGGRVREVFFRVSRSFSCAMSEAQAEAMSRDGRVELVEEDGRVTVD